MPRGARLRQQGRSLPPLLHTRLQARACTQGRCLLTHNYHGDLGTCRVLNLITQCRCCRSGTPCCCRRRGGRILKHVLADALPHNGEASAALVEIVVPPLELAQLELVCGGQLPPLPDERHVVQQLELAPIHSDGRGDAGGGARRAEDLAALHQQAELAAVRLLPQLLRPHPPLHHLHLHLLPHRLRPARRQRLAVGVEHVGRRAAAGDEVDGDGLPGGVQRLRHFEHHMGAHGVPEEHRGLVQQGKDRLHLLIDDLLHTFGRWLGMPRPMARVFEQPYFDVVRKVLHTLEQA
mmetsp:Transcript_21631/g.47517  ORF Transcript_21631/g.47517 Transcript_21631/m.47517 type:complete len:293 (-) Transcript_21631:862-1740(-)